MVKPIVARAAAHDKSQWIQAQAARNVVCADQGWALLPTQAGEWLAERIADGRIRLHPGAKPDADDFAQQLQRWRDDPDNQHHPGMWLWRQMLNRADLERELGRRRPKVGTKELLDWKAVVARVAKRGGDFRQGILDEAKAAGVQVSKRTVRRYIAKAREAARWPH